MSLINYLFGILNRYNQKKKNKKIIYKSSILIYKLVALGIY